MDIVWLPMPSFRNPLSALKVYVQQGIRKPERIQAGAGKPERIQASAFCIRSGSRQKVMQRHAPEGAPERAQKMCPN